MGETWSGIARYRAWKRRHGHYHRCGLEEWFVRFAAKTPAWRKPRLQGALGSRGGPDGRASSRREPRRRELETRELKWTPFFGPVVKVVNRGCSSTRGAKPNEEE